MNEYSSKMGLDSQNDDPLISEICEPNVLEALLAAEKLAEYRLDFGGGIYDVACRHVLQVTDSNPKKFCALLGWINEKENLEYTKELISEFKRLISESAYVL